MGVNVKAPAEPTAALILTLHTKLLLKRNANKGRKKVSRWRRVARKLMLSQRSPFDIFHAHHRCKKLRGTEVVSSEGEGLS